MNYNFEQGEILFFNKPLDWTSFDLVNKIKVLITKRLKLKAKVGHAGTLDPLASGLVIVCTGNKTKEINQFLEMDKEYVATIQLGATTPSFDLETEIDATFPTDHLNINIIHQCLQKFLGTQQQTAPTFSAKKVNGKPAYLKARKGINVEIKPSTITIKNIELMDFTDNKLKIKVICSKGTYIRALARDLGLALNTGGYLAELTRTQIGTHKLENAIEITDFEKTINLFIEK